MSTIYDQLENAAFPDDFATLLIDILSITPERFCGVKDALYHFRQLDDGLAVELIGSIRDRLESSE